MWVNENFLHTVNEHAIGCGKKHIHLPLSLLC